MDDGFPDVLLTLALSVTRCGIPEKLQRRALVMACRRVRMSSATLRSASSVMRLLSLGVLLASSLCWRIPSHRGLDGMRSRSMQVTESALADERQVKNVGNTDSVGHHLVSVLRYSTGHPCGCRSCLPLDCQEPYYVPDAAMSMTPLMPDTIKPRVFVATDPVNGVSSS